MAFSKITLALVITGAVFCSFLLFSKTENKILLKEYKCKPEDRLNDMCIEIYSPVCGHRPGLQCFTTPCNHETYPNSCFACSDTDVVSYTMGQCTILD